VGVFSGWLRAVTSEDTGNLLGAWSLIVCWEGGVGMSSLAGKNLKRRINGDFEMTAFGWIIGVLLA